MNVTILEHYQEKVKNVRNTTILEERLKPAISSRRRRRRLLAKGTLLIQNSARPHTAAAKVTTIQKLKF
jgi:hypothetical protein